METLRIKEKEEVKEVKEVKEIKEIEKKHDTIFWRRSLKQNGRT